MNENCNMNASDFEERLIGFGFKPVEISQNYPKLLVFDDTNSVMVVIMMEKEVTVVSRHFQNESRNFTYSVPLYSYDHIYENILKEF